VAQLGTWTAAIRERGWSTSSPQARTAGLSAWESVPYGPVYGLTCAAGSPSVPVRDPSLPGLTARQWPSDSSADLGRFLYSIPCSSPSSSWLPSLVP
jgi:hypothetical protein